jgi:hypothetical protein
VPSSTFEQAAKARMPTVASNAPIFVFKLLINLVLLKLLFRGLKPAG